MAEKEVVLTVLTDPGQLELLKKQLAKEGDEIITAANLLGR